MKGQVTSSATKGGGEVVADFLGALVGLNARVGDLGIVLARIQFVVDS